MPAPEPHQDLLLTTRSAAAANSWRRGAAFALAGYAAFSLHDATIKSLEGYSVFQILFFAVLFSYVPFTFSLAADSSDRSLRPRNPRWVFARSLCMVGSLCGAFVAFQSLPLAQVYSLLFATPLVITALSIPVLGERVGAARWFAVGLGIVGVLVVLQPGSTTFGAGHAAALMAMSCSATSAVITRRIGHLERDATLMVYPLLANVLVGGAALIFVYEPMPLQAFATMAAVGVLGMLGQWLLIRAYRSATAALVAPFQYSQMGWGVLYGFWWFGEVPDANVFAGLAIIMSAGLMIVWRESRGGNSRHQPLLRTRNLRAMSAAPMRSVEKDEAEGFVDASIEATATSTDPHLDGP